MTKSAWRAANLFNASECRRWLVGCQVRVRCSVSVASDSWLVSTTGTVDCAMGIGAHSVAVGRLQRTMNVCYGEHLTVDLPGNALVDHIALITSGPARLSAVEIRHS